MPFRSIYKEIYGEKVYKLPINLPVTCPNRDGAKGYGGCIYCSPAGTGYESLSSAMPVREQLARNIETIGKKYKTKLFIAYFQNYCNTYMPLQDPCRRMLSGGGGKYSGDTYIHTPGLRFIADGGFVKRNFTGNRQKNYIRARIAVLQARNFGNNTKRAYACRIESTR